MFGVLCSLTEHIITKSKIVILIEINKKEKKYLYSKENCFGY